MVLPQSWYYVALGDSLGAGVLAQRGYVPRYADFIQQDTSRRVTLVNLSRSGWTSLDLLTALRQDSNFRQQLEKANVVTFDIGGNDLLNARSKFLRNECGGPDNLDCFRSAVARFNANWDDIVEEILSIKNPSSTIMRTMDLYNPFIAVHLERGDLEKLNPFLDQVNSHIAQSAAANGISMAPVHNLFNGPSGTDDPVNQGFIAADALHPNDAGHAAIANELRNLGYSPFQAP
jgi:lysophospholipase L1-like esterase